MLRRTPSPLPLWTALTLSLAGLLAAAPGQAADKKVMIFPLVPIGAGVQPAQAVEFTNALGTELKQRGGWEPLAGAEQAVAETPKSKPSPKDYERALAELMKGDAAFNKLKFDVAIRSLLTAIKLFEDNLYFVDDWSKVRESYLMLAVAYFRRGQEREGTTYLEQIVALAPELDLDPSRYPPLFRSIFDEVRRKVLTRPRGSLQVVTNTPGATVWLNGKQLGVTPLVIHEIIEGTHHLRVALKDDAWGGTVTVRAGVTDKQVVDVGPASAGASIGTSLGLNSLSAAARAQAVAIAKAAGADLVVMGAMTATDTLFKVPLYAGEVKSGRWDRLVDLQPDLDLLGANIEAYKFAEALKAKLGAFKGDVTGDIALAAGLAVKEPAGASATMAQAAFVAPELIARVTGGAPQRLPSGLQGLTPEGGATRGPIRPVTPGASAQPTGPTPVSPAPVAAAPATPATPTGPRTRPVAPPQPDPGSARGPIAPIKPVTPLKADPQPAPAPVPAPAPTPDPGEQRGPISRATRVQQAPTVISADGSTTVTAAPVDPGLLTPPPEGSRTPALATREVVNLQAEAALGVTPFYEEWWFWTIAGVVLLGAGVGGTWLALSSGRQVDSARIVAVW